MMILVSGATGNVGSQLVKQLAASGERVRALTRNRRRAQFGAHVEMAEGDLTRTDTLDEPLRGVRGLFLIECGNEDAVVALARDAGVKRIVLLSALVAQTRPDSAIGSAHVAAERAVMESDLDWTILRPGQFASNTLRWAQMVRKHDAVYAPFADIAQPVIDPADIGAVAAVCFAEHGHEDRSYTLTGPESISPRSQLEQIGAALGRQLTFHEVPRDHARQHMIEQIPGELADSALDLLGSPTAAERERLPTVEALTGAAPGTFAQWASRHVDDFQ